jgi:dephospho-CoA kinase
MFTVGLTGGIGSGKTAASDHFQTLGVHVVDADIVAREVVEPGQPALDEIVKHFGPDILKEDRSLDRAKLRQCVFTNTTEKDWLESLLHPLIRQEITRQLAASKSAYAILVSPLLFETNQHLLVNRSLLIDVPEDLQLIRASSRDQNSQEQIQKIIDSQLPRDVKLARADDVIVNDKNLDELKLSVEKQHAIYLDYAHEQTT